MVLVRTILQLRIAVLHTYFLRVISLKSIVLIQHNFARHSCFVNVVFHLCMVNLSIRVSVCCMIERKANQQLILKINIVNRQ